VLALTVRDKRDDRLGLEDVPEPSPAEGAILVEAVALGVCGTDRLLVQRPPRLPPGQDHLIIGHESLGRVLEAPPGSGFAEGDLVVGLVRRADPVPCASCASGQPDVCENGGFTERGITGRDGFGSERFRLEPDEALRVDPGLGLAGLLVEPASIVSKAWEKLDRSARRPPARALVLGAGPIGLLAALLGAGRGYEVHVMDQLDRGPKPDQVRALGAIYHTSAASLGGGFAAVLECTGALLSEAVRQTAPGGTTCLIGEGEDRSVPVLGPGELTGELEMGNKTLVGTVSSNRRHFEAGHRALRQADPGWLAGLLGPFVALGDWRSAFAGDADRIKAVIDFGAGPPPRLGTGDR
jgi:threonine dehydrogenase-like Zn-dependent dehydrogenase